MSTLAAAAVAALLGVTACASSNADTSAADAGSNSATSAAAPTAGSTEIPNVAGKNITIGVSIMSHVPWLDSYGRALTALGKRYGVNVKLMYADGTPQTQASQVQTLVAQKPAAIIYTGIDPATDDSLLAQIKAAGIITVGGIIQPDAAGMKLLDAYRGPNDLTHGKLAADAMAKALAGKTGDIAIVRGDPGGTDNTNRASAFKAEIAKVAPGLKIVADQDSSFGDEKKPYDVTTSILAAHPDVIGIFAEADSIANAAAKAVANAGKTGHVQIVGVGGSCEGFADVRAGTVYSTTLQDPPAGARDVFAASLQLIQKQPVAPVAYMDLPIVTKKNVSQYACHW